MEDKMIYKPRVIDGEIDECMKIFGGVCVYGPARCGKSTTAEKHCGSGIYLHSPEYNYQSRALADMSPETAIEGPSPRLIDEWQEVPKMWDAVRYDIDRRGEKGRYLLTCSSRPKNLKTAHDGTGRIERLRMRTMSLYETGDSDGSVSLERLCEGKLETRLTKDLSLTDLAKILVRGGWPENTGTVFDVAAIPKSYAEEILYADTKGTDGIKYSSQKLGYLLRSLSRLDGTTASLRDIKSDVAKEIPKGEDGPFEGEMAINTIIRYLDYLDRIFVTENTSAFTVIDNYRGRAKQAPKRHLCDPSLACAFLGLTPEALIGNLNTMEKMFTALCEHDLKIYAQSFSGKVYSYRDYFGAEIDSVIEMPDGKWCAFDARIGENKVDSAAADLARIKTRLEKTGGTRPSVMCVVCGLTGYARRLESGVFVVPISALKP